MSSTNGKNIALNELYSTPAVAVDSLIEVISFLPDDTFREPCYGLGAIFNKVPLPRMNKSFAELAFNIDYLERELPQVDVIITNPPFSLTEEFIKKALSELKPNGTFACLQRLNYLGSVKRVPFWEEVGFPDKTPIIVPRPRFNNGKSDSCEYAWFIWDFGNRVKLPLGLSHLISKTIVKPKKENVMDTTVYLRTKLSVKSKTARIGCSHEFSKGTKLSTVLAHLIKHEEFSLEELATINNALKDSVGGLNA